MNIVMYCKLCVAFSIVCLDVKKLIFVWLLFLTDSPWKVYMDDVSPALTSLLVIGLTPARTYQFRVCAVNQVGRGQYSSETNR